MDRSSYTEGRTMGKSKSENVLIIKKCNQPRLFESGRDDTSRQTGSQTFNKTIKQLSFTIHQDLSEDSTSQYAISYKVFHSRHHKNKKMGLMFPQ